MSMSLLYFGGLSGNSSLSGKSRYLILCTIPYILAISYNISFFLLGHSQPQAGDVSPPHPGSGTIEAMSFIIIKMYLISVFV